MNKITIMLLLLGIIIITGCTSQPIMNPDNSNTQSNNAIITNTHQNTPANSNGDTTPYSINQAKILGVNPYTNDTDGDGIADKQDQNPNQADETITSSGIQGFIITDAIVENNIDSTTKNTAPDHLEITLQNKIGKDIQEMKVYYSMHDSNTKKTESYITPLTGFTLKAHATETIHFDAQKSFNEQLPVNHFAANPNSIYYLSKDTLEFSIIISADGYNAQTIKVKKDSGGAEQPD